ncbi:MAG: AAA family ATPase, partial [Duodenibacillus sp.]|nr:AAA family ATPase [Duodenibacillus sp.]
TYRISIPEFDPRAVREGIVNAFAHRDYARLGRVLVRMDSDGLTISNPGGFIEGVTYENILSVEPHGRNPALADALKRIGLAERSGRGVDRIYEGSLHFGRALPSYLGSTSSCVSLFIPRDKPDMNLTGIIAREVRRTGLPMPLNALMALNALKDGAARSLASINALCKLPASKLEATLQNLAESGLLATTGGKGERKYALRTRKPAEKPAGNPHPKAPAEEFLRQQERVLALADERGLISRKDVMDSLAVPAPRAYYLLRKLKEKGLLTAEGTTNAARYSRPGP